jgi:hypothetical protein
MRPSLFKASPLISPHFVPTINYPGLIGLSEKSLPLLIGFSTCYFELRGKISGAYTIKLMEREITYKALLNYYYFSHENYCYIIITAR